MRGAPAVLMMGESMRKALQLEDFLKRTGWSCQVEPELPAALRLAETQPYDLILSGVRMDRCCRASLVNSVIGSKASLFFSMAVEYGCWWLPAVRQGENCADSPALSPRRFAEEIGRLRLSLLLPSEPAPASASAVAAALTAASKKPKRPAGEPLIAAALRLSA